MVYIMHTVNEQSQLILLCRKNNKSKSYLAHNWYITNYNPQHKKLYLEDKTNKREQNKQMQDIQEKSHRRFRMICKRCNIQVCCSWKYKCQRAKEANTNVLKWSVLSRNIHIRCHMINYSFWMILADDVDFWNVGKQGSNIILWCHSNVNLIFWLTIRR